MTENIPQTAAESPTEIPLGKFPYGWDGVASTLTRPTGRLDAEGNPERELFPFPQFYTKQFTHVPRTIIVGAPKRGPKFANIERKTRRQLIRHNQTKGTRYIVWSDRSLRRVDKVLRKQFSTMTPAEQNKLISEAAARAQVKEAA